MPIRGVEPQRPRTTTFILHETNSPTTTSSKTGTPKRSKPPSAPRTKPQPHSNGTVSWALFTTQQKPPSASKQHQLGRNGMMTLSSPISPSGNVRCRSVSTTTTKHPRGQSSSDAETCQKGEQIKLIESLSPTAQMFEAVRAITRTRAQPLLLHDATGKYILHEPRANNLVRIHFPEQLSILKRLPIQPDLEVRGLDSPITATEFTSALRGLNTRRAFGPDGIPGELLKYGADTLAPHLVDLVNHSFERGQPLNLGEGFRQQWSRFSRRISAASSSTAAPQMPSGLTGGTAHAFNATKSAFRFSVSTYHEHSTLSTTTGYSTYSEHSCPTTISDSFDSYSPTRRWFSAQATGRLIRSSATPEPPKETLALTCFVCSLFRGGTSRFST
ncbi:unnamed protein product [Phytophthora fragariaefolia]|uniref:Unnamed protein product n=1 Tax=Phytophthora fragariaefolia TaxID=1490495 RepID=A0A9W6X2C3_9STRA|nr:unnamed protein product [Phytophthora fragariaefolia]